MSGLDSAISSLLAARSELFLTALRGAGGSATAQTATQTGVANTAATPGTYGPNPYAGASAPASSTQTALSSVARTLDVISRLGGAAPAVTGEAPLWPVPPRPASAFAALTTGLFDTAFSSNAAAVAAARAASQNLPPLPATQVAAQLARTVDESGLFYESHLAQWLAGQRSAATLSGEPQARVDTRAQSLPFDFTDVESTDIGLMDDASPAHAAPLASDSADAALPPVTIEMPQNPQQAAALAASVRDAPASALSHSQTAPATSHAQASTASTTVDAPHESAVQASLAAGIHPATLTTVRQQLDMLANGQFRWQGEAWPGTRFDWEIERDAVERREPRDPEEAAAEQAWRTRITLSLPVLGMVDAELVLTRDKLIARIRASDIGATRLAGDGGAFARRLEAAGIALASLSVRSMDGHAEFDTSGDTRRAASRPVPSPLAHLFEPPAGDGGA
jgi:hypothetical protein